MSWFGSTGDEEEGQAKATMDGENQGGRERERRTTRADAGPSCTEATRLIHRPHVKWDKMWEKKKTALEGIGGNNGRDEQGHKCLWLGDVSGEGIWD